MKRTATNFHTLVEKHDYVMVFGDWRSAHKEDEKRLVDWHCAYKKECRSRSREKKKGIDALDKRDEK